MLSEHLKDALSQVKQLQEAVVERQRFRGYSGLTRMISGTIALAAAPVMSWSRYPATPRAHFIGWGAVFVAALVLNACALLYWFFNDPRVNRNIWRLKPTIDFLPPLVVGGVLTFTMIISGLYDYLFGVWMCMFGLSNLASRNVLPGPITLVGLFYLVCGSAWLIAPDVSFLNPWPMGIVFFAGEWGGGLVLHLDQTRYLSFERHQHFVEEDNGEITDEATQTEE